MTDLRALIDSLNPEQREAARQTEGPLLVLAGAGSGKTRVITTRIAYLIAAGHAKPEQILAVTFTNKAAEEMRARVAQIVGKAAAKKILISTFHSFCLRVLREEITSLGYRKDFTICRESDTRTIMRRILDDMDGVKESFKPDLFLEAIGTLKSSDAAPDESAEADSEETETQKKYRTWLPAIYEQYQSALRAANTLDFDDLLLLTLKLWREHPAVLERARNRFRYVLVDEFQDTNRVQYALLHALVKEHRNLCVVGDDDQSIYAWRGADPRNILDFEKDFPEARIIKLEQNYRSTRTILDAANGVIQNNTVRRPKKLWSRHAKGRAIDWIVVGDEEHEAKMALSWMKLIQGKTGARWRDFAILYRSNNQARPFEIAFRQAGVPYVVVGGQEFFDRAEVKDVVSYLKVVANPRDESAFLRIVNTPRRGIGDATLHRIHERCAAEHIPFGQAMAQVLERGDASPEAAKGIRELLALLSEFRAKFREPNTSMAETARDLMDRIGLREDLLRTAKTPGQFETRWSNVEAVIEAIDTYAKETEQTPSLMDFLDRSSLLSNEDRRSRKERRDSGVTLMTVHSAKGLEYPFVFIAGMEEGIFPHDRSVRDGAIEEERRLFYVAITRAQRHLTIFECLSRVRFGKDRMSKPSPFLAELPEGLVKKNVIAVRDDPPEEEPAAKPAPKKQPRKRGNRRATH